MVFGLTCRTICVLLKRITISWPKLHSTRLTQLSSNASKNSSSSKETMSDRENLEVFTATIILFSCVFRNYRNMTSFSKYFVFGNNSVSEQSSLLSSLENFDIVFRRP